MTTAIEQRISAHEEHPWYKVGRCVYCGPCQTRLFSGEMPAGHPVWEQPKRRPPAANAMRERWNMDDRK